MIFLRKRRRLSVDECLRILLLILANLCALPSPANARFRICGERLTRTMSTICKNKLCGGYFVPTKKRSLPDLLLPSSALLEKANGYERRRRRAPAFDEESADDQFDGDYRPLNFQKRYSIAQDQVYGRRYGIANQCCEKRCSLAYLKTYCCANFQIGSNKNEAAAVKNGGVFTYAVKPPAQAHVPHFNVAVPPQMLGALSNLDGAKFVAAKLVSAPGSVQVTTAAPAPPSAEADEATIEDESDEPEDSQSEDGISAEENQNLSESLNETPLTVL